MPPLCLDLTAGKSLKAGKSLVIEEFGRMAGELLQEETLKDLQEKIEGRKWRFYRYGKSKYCLCSNMNFSNRF